MSMAPRKSSKRIKVKTRNNNNNNNNNNKDVDQANSSSRRNISSTRPSPVIPTSNNDVYANQVGVASGDRLQSKQQQQHTITTHSSHPPDCQCYLKRVGNLFLPPQQKIDLGFNHDEDDDIDKS